MNELMIFDNQDFGQIRTLEENGKILFCASDIAKALGYSNPSKAIGDHCRYVTKRYVPHPQSKDKTIQMSFIPEGDVYRLITHSKLPSAERFESWLFDEVLPSIRKTGGYSMGNAKKEPKPMTEYQNERIRVEKAKLLSKMADLYTGSYQQILHSYATKELEGDFILPLPALPQKTLSAKEVGEELGVSANVIGRIANQYGLKNDANGQWFKDKSPYGDKEVSTFRYFENSIDTFRGILDQENAGQ